MEFLRAHKRRSLLSEIVYILLNVGLAASIIALVWATGTPWLALLLVVLSKWRVFAVRPRYWFTHLETNMVDIIVGVSTVVLLYLANQSGVQYAVVVQIIIAILYACWLLLLKPRAKRAAVVLQAGVAVTVGTMALASVSYEWPSFLVVLIMWVIGYSTARHVLASYSETDVRLLSMIWAFVMAEIGWLSYHWTIAYPIMRDIVPALKIPQMTIIVLCLSFLAERFYASYHRHGVVKQNDILLPLIFTIGLLVVLLFTKLNQAAIGVV